MVRIGLVILLFSLPEAALAAGLVPCSGPDCQACNLIQLGQNILKFLIFVSIFIAGVVFAVGGLELATSAGNEGQVSKAKQKFTNAIVGLFIILAAWLVVDTVMKALYKPEVSGSVQFGPWNAIQCVELPKALDPSIVLQARGSLPGQYINGQFVPGGPNGVYPYQSVTGTGSCDPSFMAQQGWGANAASASCICQKESGGVPGILSRVDRTTDGNAFSVGLFQINISNHDLYGCAPGGGDLKCTQAFSGTSFSATVKDKTLYDQCVAAAADGSCSSRNAQQIQQSRGWNQWTTASQCGL